MRLVHSLLSPTVKSSPFVGDDGLTMTLGELATCVKYQLPVKVFVIKNTVLGQIRWEQLMFLGNPEYGVELESIEFARVAEACRMRGFKVEHPDDVGGVIAEALRTPGPVLAEAVTDPFEPLMPSNLKPEQAEKICEGAVQGSAKRERIGVTFYCDAIEDPDGNWELLS